MEGQKETILFSFFAYKKVRLLLFGSEAKERKGKTQFEISSLKKTNFKINPTRFYNQFTRKVRNALKREFHLFVCIVLDGGLPSYSFKIVPEKTKSIRSPSPRGTPSRRMRACLLSSTPGWQTREHSSGPRNTQTSSAAQSPGFGLYRPTRSGSLAERRRQTRSRASR